jgi:hypothetical protein
MKPVSAGHDISAKQSGSQAAVMIFARSSTMSTIISLIYRAYCQARIAEIQKIGG